LNKRVKRWLGGTAILLVMFLLGLWVGWHKEAITTAISKHLAKAPAEREQAIVTVDQNDEIKLDGRTIAVEELEAAVRNLPETRRSSLALQADKKASFGAIGSLQHYPCPRHLALGWLL
jgi:biopolymer transport protein ExbD